MSSSCLRCICKGPTWLASVYWLATWRPGAGFAALKQQLDQSGDGITLLEGAGGLSDGLLYGLSLVQVARGLQAPVVLVHSWNGCHSAESLLAAREQLGDLLCGVVLNGLPPEQVPLGAR